MYKVIISGIETLMLTYLFIVFEIDGLLNDGDFSNSPDKTDNALQPWLEIPSQLNTMCSYSVVCPEYFRTSYRTSSYPCCTDCSCDPAICKVKDNCCFPELHALPSNRRQHQSCIYPVATTLAPEDSMFFIAYYMVTKNPVGGCRYSPEYIAETGIDPGVDCGDLTIAPWGSLLPVYSMMNTSTIYKNRHCAVCYGVKDAEFWNATIFCRLDKDKIKEKVDFLSLDLPFCHPRFVSDRKKELKSEECYVDLIDDCPKDFTVDPGVKMTQQAVLDACKSGFYSPFKHLYRNVFCYICHKGGITQQTFRCQPRETDMEGSVKAVGDDIGDYRGPKLLGLLDYDFLKMMENSHSQQVSPGVHVACNNDGKKIVVSKCRPLFCPTGQIRYTDGSCRYVNPVWMDKKYKMYIKLIPEKVMQLNQIPGEIKKHLKSPWSTAWQIGAIFLPEDDSSILKYIVVVLGHESNDEKGTNPTIFIQKTIRENLSKTWEIRLQENTVVMQQEILKYTTLRPTPEEMVLPWNPTSINFTAPYMQLPYSGVYDESEGSLITKMFFCDQIELQKSEFELITVKSFRLLRHGDIILQNSEFTSFQDSNGNHVSRICIEDSELVVRPPRSGFTSLSSKMSVLAYCACIYLVM